MPFPPPPSQIGTQAGIPNSQHPAQNLAQGYICNKGFLDKLALSNGGPQLLRGWQEGAQKTYLKNFYSCFLLSLILLELVTYSVLLVKNSSLKIQLLNKSSI